MSTPENPGRPSAAPAGDGTPPSEVEALLREILSTLRGRPPAPVEEGASPTEAELLLREIISTLRNHPAAPLAEGAQLEAGVHPHATVPPAPEAPPRSESEAVDTPVFFAVVTWLILGIIALGNKNLQTSLITEIIIVVCTFAQPALIFGLFARLNKFFPGSGTSYFVAGVVGVFVTTACTFAFTDMMKAATIFWCLSGNYLGWILVSAAQRVIPLLRRASWAEGGGRAALASSSGYELVEQEVADAEDATATAELPTQAKMRGQ